ncbi:hypothetical protein PsorP6_018749 [Peronosclerospora sorghi]|nr:hypothetical protein PsorP6_018749 [Peronosclerospora sorghi]
MNDIYNTFLGDLSRDVKPYKMNLIYPETDRHVRKHTDQTFYMVVETKEAYRKITNPYIDSIPPDSIDWVYNILEQKSETDRIIYEDKHPRNGFVLLADIKWSDLSQVVVYSVLALESLYCLGIMHDRSLRSLRDLTGAHINLLRNIRYLLFSHISGTLSSLYVLPANSNTTLEVLHRKFGVNASFIRPTYYHLYVHFSHVKMTQGKAVLLEDVINNLCMNCDHYEKATLSYVIGEVQQKQLFELYREKHII